ncbi:MAG: LytR/AlgR family response regulator transcription factor [Oscillospiraceae bacterium]
MRTAICEDEKIYSDKLSESLKKYLFSHNEKTKIDLFTDGVPLAEKLESGSRYDVIFLDIQLESSDGMDTAEIIRQYDKNVPVIFVTGLENRASDGYAVQAFDYIIKSDFDAKFEKVMTRLMQTLTKKTLSLEDVSGNLEIILIADIMYVESEGRGTAVHTAEKAIHTNIPISKLSEELSDYVFIEIYKAIYVNISKIKRTLTDTLELSDGKILPMSRRRKKAVLTAVMERVRSEI